MRVFRTPDERFQHLPEFDFAPHYVQIGDTRMHYLDEGAGVETILCLHGEPTWCYLYRRMIPPLAGRYRVIAPDLVGFGRSDKYAAQDDYSFHRHYEKLLALIEALELRDLTLICQDWGGLLGLALAADYSDRFARLVVLNTFLPTGEDKISEAFLQWRAFSQKVGTRMQVGRLIAQTITNYELPDEIIAAYDAPYPDDSYKAGAAVFPSLVPITPDMPGAHGDESGAALNCRSGASPCRSCSAMATRSWAARLVSSAGFSQRRPISRRSRSAAPDTFCKKKKAPKSPPKSSPLSSERQGKDLCQSQITNAIRACRWIWAGCARPRST